MWGKTTTSNNVKHSDLDQNVQISRAAGASVPSVATKAKSATRMTIGPHVEITIGAKMASTACAGGRRVELSSAA
jgi:hypothetical protein